ncbi:MAG: alpha/beta hydrolase [Oscillospiraceae bacterium]|nr:alpha/beta hydrolase [Oscillospiraceae bacterium]
MFISYILFTRFFGYHPAPDSAKGAPASESTERLMGPGFEAFRDASIDATQSLEKREHTRLDIRSDDGLRLSAAYFRCVPVSDKLAILVHGHNSHGMRGNAIKALRYLDAGFNVLLPDNRACGRSEGKWETFGAKESRDTLRWIERIVSENKNAEIFLDGCSLGGATVCLLAGMELPDNVRFLVSDCAFARAKDEFRYILKHCAGLPAFPFLYTLDLWDRMINRVSYKDQCPVDAVRRARVPMLFMHGAEDRYIPVSQAELLHNACSADNRLVLVEGAGHAAASMWGGDKYFDPVLEFAQKCMTGDQICEQL